MKYTFIILFLTNNLLLFGQKISGTVFEKNSNTTIEYVNIGIVGKSVGTVSDNNGKYSLQIKPEHKDDTLRVSCIGYCTYSIKVSDFLSLKNHNIGLEKRTFELQEVVVSPKKIKSKTLGVTTSLKTVICCYGDSLRGQEFGILMNNKKTAFIKTMNINVAYCNYDTVFYRINFYKVVGDLQFENILSQPVYLNISKKEIKDKITIDLSYLNLWIEGDFLVTLESIKDLGKDTFCFCASILHSMYFRKTSQDEWKKFGVCGASISVEVDAER